MRKKKNRDMKRIVEQTEKNSEAKLTEHGELETEVMARLTGDRSRRPSSPDLLWVKPEGGRTKETSR